MDGIALIQEATQAGLTVWLEEGNLKVKGPRRLSALAAKIVQNKDMVIAALVSRSPAAVQIDEPCSVDADTRPKNAGENTSSVGAGGTKEVAPQDCRSLHIQPQHWVHRDGRACCPGCEKFMGYVRGSQ